MLLQDSNIFTTPTNLPQGKIHQNGHHSGKSGWCVKLAEYASDNRTDITVDVIFRLRLFEPTAKLDEFSNRFGNINSAVSHSSE